MKLLTLKRILILFSALAGLSSIYGTGFAAAQDANEYSKKGSYVTLSSNYGLNYEGDESLNGFNLEAKAGHDFNPHFGVELETGWFVFDAEAEGVDLGNVHMFPLLINGVVRYPVHKFVPYASGGTGVFFFGFDESDLVESIGGSVDYDNAAYGFKTAGGFDYYFTQNFAFNFESGFFFIIDPDVTATVPGVSVTGEGDVDTWYVGGGLKWKF